MAGSRCLLKAPSNFQSSVIFESMDGEGDSLGNTIRSSVTACHKVLCSISPLDSTEYWLRNEKALCRLSLQEDGIVSSSCTATCFVNLDQEKLDYNDDSCIKKLAVISPELPNLVNSLSARQTKQNEILLLSGLEASPDTGHSQSQRPDVCLVHSVEKSYSTQPGSILLDINKFLIGLQWGYKRQCKGRLARQCMEDDTNHSISSIEDEFLTASEHLGDDSEDDGFRNDPESSDIVEIHSESKMDHSRDLGGQRCRLDRLELSTCTPSAASKNQTYSRTSCPAHESAGYYATNLAETVLQDAFIRLSQEESSFSPEAAESMSLSSQHASQTEGPPMARTCSFELPKIVIVQSLDNCEGADLPVASGSPVPEKKPTSAAETENGPVCICSDVPPSKPIKVACAASVIGTITTPQVTKQLTTEEQEENRGDASPCTDYSFSSAICGMAQVAGAVAIFDLAEESRLSNPEVYSASQGFLSAAEASTAFALHCSIAEGTSIEAFRENLAEVLHREAADVMGQPHCYRSVAHLLEATRNNIVDGITSLRKAYVGNTEMEDFIVEVADSLFKHALEKAMKRKELEGPGKDAPNLQGFLRESVNNLLFDVLCLTSKKIIDISTKCNLGSLDTQDEVTQRDGMEPLCQFNCSVGSRLPDYNSEIPFIIPHCIYKLPMLSGSRDQERERALSGSPNPTHFKDLHQHGQIRASSTSVKYEDDVQIQKTNMSHRGEPVSEISILNTEKEGRVASSANSRQSFLTTQSSLNSCSSLAGVQMDSCELSWRTHVSCFADDLAATVVSMATELAAICLENSTGKQPWFYALKNTWSEGVPREYLLPCCSLLRKKEGQNWTVSKKHRPPRLSEIKRKTEEHPELMERLVNRVVDETMEELQQQDPFVLFASEVTTRILNCPELNVVDTSKGGQSSRSRLQYERWSRGKASSYESIPEEDGGRDPTKLSNTLGPGCHLGQNLSRGSSISKQSSCESITDEFSRFMVNQMETEGRGFDLLLDYYAGKNAANILTAAIQQVSAKRNDHLNVTSNSCLSKQSSTESITEEFYRFMLKDMDKENKDCIMAKTKEWSNTLLPPTLRSPFYFRQSSVPDRRSSDSRLTVNSPIKANSFDGFARSVHVDTLNVFTSNSGAASGLCKSDSCLYQRGQTDQFTDKLIHETWSNSIESLMRKNKVIPGPSEANIDLEASAQDSQPHLQEFANRLATDIVEIGKLAVGVGIQEGCGAIICQQHHTHVGERRRGFKQSRPGCSKGSRASQEQPYEGSTDGTMSASPRRGQREVPLIHIEEDRKDKLPKGKERRPGFILQDVPLVVPAQRRASASCYSGERDRSTVAAVMAREKRSMSASSEESTGSWSHMAPDDVAQDETSCFIQLSDGNGTSTASSLGTADLDAFLDMPTPSTIISDISEKCRLTETKENLNEDTSTQTVRGRRDKELLVLNCDLGQDCVESELRVALQWIAASELGLHDLYFKKSKEERTSKLLRVVQMTCQKKWKIADLFRAVDHFCKLHKQENCALWPSLFDWLLDTQ